MITMIGDVLQTLPAAMQAGTRQRPGGLRRRHHLDGHDVGNVL